MGALTGSNITCTPLRRIENLNGDVLHGMKSGDTGYVGFGEAYFSWIYPGAIKAWKRHTRMTMNLIVPCGKVRFAFLSPGEKSLTENLGDDNYVRITVTPGIWFGFQGLGNSPSLVLNIADSIHDPAEVERLPADHFDYNWEIN